MQLWLLLLPCLLLPARAQIGSDCSDTVACAGGNQDCSLGYCRCSQGFVKHAAGECVPEAGFNETCGFDDQCVDFRLKCSQGRCACVKYFHWDEYSRQCITFKDLKYMLTDMGEERNSHDRLMSESGKVFASMMWTGLSVVLIGVVLALGCVFYGCCLGRSSCCRPHEKLSDARLDVYEHRIPTGHQRNPTTETTVPSSSDTQGQFNRGASGTSQGTGIDYIPALYASTSFV